VLESSIVWDNEATGEDTFPIDGGINGNVGVLYSCVQWLLEPIPGEDPPNPDDFPGSHDSDPLFLDLPGRDLHLGPGSPCIDAGDNTCFPPEILTDLDGLARFFDDPETPDTGNGTPPIADMGAYEFGSIAASTPVPVADRGARLGLSVWPNPSAGAVRIRYSRDDGTSDRVELGIYDVLGRLVRDVTPASERASGAISWDGRDGLGHEAAAGVYFIQASGDGPVATRRFLLIR
jgi:hypothetical protein